MKKQAKPETKQNAAPQDDAQLQTRVLLEEIHSEVKIVGEQHGTVIKRLDDINATLNRHEEELQIIKTAVRSNSSELKSVKLAVMDVDVRVARVETKLNTTIAQNEERFKKIEDKLQIV